VLEDIDRGLSRLSEALERDDAMRGAVRLTVPGPIAAHIVVPALPGFRAAHPAVELVLLATSRVLDVARGEADVAVRNTVPSGGGIVSRKIAQVKVALYASRSYLLHRGTPPLPSLRGHDFVDQRLAAIGFGAAEGHRGALGGEGAHELGADARAAAGDEDDAFL
jgi:DNA-binding transcriptional LysR family regulator